LEDKQLALREGKRLKEKGKKADRKRMTLVLGVDLGTTTITALAVDAGSGDLVAVHTLPNRAETTAAADKARGFSEWDARCISETACTCLRTVGQRLTGLQPELAGLGITGQQHGVIIVDEALHPLTPFINWQDRRGEQLHPASQHTYVYQAGALAGEDAPRRTGCKLATGYLAVTLFWLKETGALPPAGKACFLMDYFGSVLTGRPPVTDPTCAASSGLLDLAAQDWHPALFAGLGLPRALFCDVRPSGELLGPLTAAVAETTGLPAGLPVFVGIGDNQASFLGGVADRANTALVNVGTGGQVAVYADRFFYDPLLETRPFPRGGYLLVSAGLCGGASYAVLERFYREVGNQVCGVAADAPLYAAMNRLAASVAPGAGGLQCEPFFSGTRARPELRAAWIGVSAENFTPAHLTRALLEGMARAFREGYERMARHRQQPCRLLVGTGNGLRENPVLAGIVADTFGLPLLFPHHREEAAYGAALLAAVGAGVCADLPLAGRLIRYTRP
jgi:sugar (pentulose or hexulose) kinase